MKDDGGWKLLDSRHLFRSKWFALRQDELRLPSGEEITYTLIEHPGYAMVLPLLDDGRVVMERVFRHPVQRTVLECPSGSLDGEDPRIAAGRELEEETGYRAGRLDPLGKSFLGSDGISDEHFYLFLARDLVHTGNTRREPTEQMEIDLIPLSELRAAVLRGEIEDAPTALSILLAVARPDVEREPHHSP